MTSHTVEGVEAMEKTLNQILLFRRSQNTFILMADYDLVNKKIESSKGKNKQKNESKHSLLEQVLVDKKMSKIIDMKQLIELIQTDKYVDTQKNTLILYYLHELLQSENQSDDIIEDFCYELKIPLYFNMMIKGIWLFDQKLFEESCNILCHPSVISNTSNYLALILLREFYSNERIAESLQYYVARNPDISTIEECSLILDILLSKELHHDAFLLQRTFSRSTQHSGNENCVKILLYHIIRVMMDKKSLGTLFKFPLDELEQKHIVNYFKEQKDDLSKEILLLFHLQRNQVDIAFEYFKEKDISKDNKLGSILKNYQHLVPEFKKSTTTTVSKPKVTREKKQPLPTPLRRSKRLAKTSSKD